MYFDYELDNALVALKPNDTRGMSRLMVVNRKAATIKDRSFEQLLDYLVPGDLLVLNDSRVLPARLVGRKKSTGGRVEVLLEKQLSPRRWQILTTLSAKKPVEVEFYADNGHFFSGEISAQCDNNGGMLKLLNFKKDVGHDELDSIGLAPLPPYITRLRKIEADKWKDYNRHDKDRYQTVYARNNGSIAAPTAGLHFSCEFIQKLQGKGIEIAYLTLHVGYSTFQSITASDFTKHKMGSEEYHVSAGTLKKLIDAKRQKRRIVSVGTTTTRVLESIGDMITRGEETGPEGRTGRTDLFIFPGYQFHVIDLLVTNFHMPRSSLLLLASAFTGDTLLGTAYKNAQENGYFFYSFGDAMLVI